MQDIKQRVALTSIAASAGLTLAKGVVGLATGSLAILSEAAHSLLDLAATIMTYFAVRVSGRPADEEHHYGHGKVESVTALAETALLFLLSGIVIWEAGHRLIGGETHAVEATVWAFGVIVGLDRGRFLPRARSLSGGQGDRERGAGGRRAAFRLRHVVVRGGPHRSWRSPHGLSVGGLGGRDRRRAVHLRGRLAARPPHHRDADRHRAGRRRDQIKAIATRIAGVVAVDRVRVRPAGHTMFVDLDVAVSRTLPLDRVAAIKDRIVTAVRGEFPTAETTVNSEPRALDDETVLERVMVIARNRALAIHHVTVQAIAGRLSVSLDLEVDGSLALQPRP